MENCIFCKIINNEIPSYKVYEDEICVAFLDISQATLGHTLVLPKKHFDNLLTIDSEILKHLFYITQKLAQCIYHLPNVKGINILNNCNEVAGQSVNHFHIHIIPRYNKDELTIKSNTENKLNSEEFNKLAKEINKLMY